MAPGVPGAECAAAGRRHGQLTAEEPPLPAQESGVSGPAGCLRGAIMTPDAPNPGFARSWLELIAAEKSNWTESRACPGAGPQFLVSPPCGQSSGCPAAQAPRRVICSSTERLQNSAIRKKERSAGPDRLFWSTLFAIWTCAVMVSSIYIFIVYYSLYIDYIQVRVCLNDRILTDWVGLRSQHPQQK